MNQEELQKKIREYYAKLTPKAQEVFASLSWLETLKKIAGRHNLNEDQIQILGTETTLVLLGIISRDEYEKILNEELKLEIQLDSTSQNDLLQLLLQKGQVTHFVEKIPSVNDIFIKTVTE